MNEPLILTFIKHPFVWTGLGLWVRYYNDDSGKASFWKGVGALSLGVGAAQSLLSHAKATPSVKQLSLQGIK